MKLYQLIFLFSLVALTSAAPVKTTPAASAAAGNPAQGKTAFQQCSFCHENGEVGPRLNGLFRRKRMKDKKTVVTDEAVRHKILEGGDGMPPFRTLSAKQVDDLLAYLKTL